LETEQGYLKERHFSLGEGRELLGKFTPLGTKSVYKGKYLSQGWTPVLKGTCGRTHPLFQGMIKHLCHSNPNLVRGSTLKYLE
jgi:hypothetical protein